MPAFEHDTDLMVPVFDSRPSTHGRTSDSDPDGLMVPDLERPHHHGGKHHHKKHTPAPRKADLDDLMDPYAR